MKFKLTDGQLLAEAAADLMFEMFRDWSVDELLLHPQEAINLCVAVRRKLSKRTPDDEILRALLNSRKHGRLPARRKAS